MKNAIILHGAGNNSQGNWFPWIKKELEEKGYNVFSPDLSNSDTPILKDWLDTIFSNKDFVFNNETLLVGHSSGATLILRILEQLPKGVKINKAIMVAAPVELGTIPEYFPYKKDLIKGGFNWQKIKNSCEEFYFIHSENDKYQCGTPQGKILEKNLGGNLIIKPNEGHFNLEVGPQYKEFPLLLELID